MINVIILAQHGDRWLKRCLETLATASSRTMRLTLVDNHHNENISELDLSAFDAKILKTPHPVGFSEGNNFGLVESMPQPDYVVFLNQDTWGEEGWLDRCVELLSEQQKWGAVSPLLRKYDHSELDTGFVSTLLDSHIDPSHLDAEDLVGAKHVPATALVVRWEALLKAGPFDPVFESYYEDYDLCRRLQEAGYGVAVLPAAVVHHFSGSASKNKKAVQKRTRLIQRNRLLHRLRMQKSSRIPALMFYFFVDWPRRLIRGLFRRKGAQPVSVTFLVSRDILTRLKRFASRSRDAAAWQDYLKKLGWPEA